MVIKNPRLDTVSREVLRYPEFRDRVKLGRVRDHFICKHGDGRGRGPSGSGQNERTRTDPGVDTDSIESTGAYKPEELLPESIKIMLSKIASVEHCMRVKFPGLVPASKEMQMDPEEMAANEGRAVRKAGKRSKK